MANHLYYAIIFMTSSMGLFVRSFLLFQSPVTFPSPSGLVFDYYLDPKMQQFLLWIEGEEERLVIIN